MDTALDTEGRIVACLRQIMRAVDLHSHRLMEEHGLTGPQLATLQATARREPTTPGELARHLHLSPATVTGILTRLEQRQLIQRNPSSGDRRKVQVRLTREGRNALVDAPSLLQDRFRVELSRLEDWERNLILSTLQRIASMMDAEDLDAAPHLVTHGPSLGAHVGRPQETTRGG
jgi:DNA-binding MarR family transcriptional regulator